ncbi:hypothetical protein ACFSTE_08130 [Aquimarina hainanensis]|uniref:Right handed beta helix region n=1 Tax=Aquimarina hainanensis TaxID=1578017 RepID=A0ABW5N5J8_9FLAO|nr:hypothetical protein [Aquimarina sp. TRL1]QKX05209.1 hypothetical protein HN014_09835 [Aquimarina sp. TRL1]
MRLTNLILLFTLLIANLLSAQNFNQNEHRWIKGWTNFEPNKVNYPEAEEKLPNIIDSDTFLRNDIVYLLSGDVYVTSGAALTIQKGTVIRCDHENPANLIITRGSKLIAAGTEAYPIVFTSNKSPKSRTSGDWGGITIVGSGKINTVSGSGVIQGNFNPQFAIYGGDQHDEQTTILRYLRIEYAGNKTKKGKGSHALSLYGLGSTSILDHIMISHSALGSFSWKGGRNNTKNLISYKAEANDYDISEGFKGDLNNVIAIRHPYITCSNGSYALAVNGYNHELGYIKPNAVTDVTITDATLVNLSDSSNYQHTTAAIKSSNLATLYIHNSKISGFSNVIKFDKSYSSVDVIEKTFKMDNSFFNIHGDGVESRSIEKTSIVNILKYNRFTKDFLSAEDLFKDPTNIIAPKFQLKQSLNNYTVMQE